MKSIRHHLLARLLPGYLLLWAAGGSVIYFAVKQQLEAELNSEVRELLGVMPYLPSPEHDYLVDLEDFNSAHGIYYQIWTRDGEELTKSRNLGEIDLAKPDIRYPDARGDFSDIRLGSLEVRALSIAVESPTSGPILVTVAMSMEDVQASMLRLAVSIVGVGLLAGAGFVALVVISLRSGLEPLTLVGDKASKIDSDSLEARFAEEGMPLELRPIVTRLNSLIERLEAGFARERRFSSDLAHELRSPVAALRSNCEYALKWPEKVSKEDLAEMLAISKELEVMIGHMLMLARLENKGEQLQWQRLDLQACTRECWADVEELAQARDISCQYELAEKRMMMRADPTLLRIILTNLFSNAVEYAPEGSVITIGPGNQEEGEFLMVSNPAPQMTERDIEHLFDRFWRGDKARGHAGHCGLGLSLVKTCAELMDWRIRAQLRGKDISFTLCKIEGQASGASLGSVPS